MSKTLGKRIALCRKQARLSQAKLAEKLGVTPTAIACWENGKNGISIEAAMDLCRVLNVRPSILLGSSIPNDTFSPEALDLVWIFDTLDPHSKSVVLAVARAEAKRPQPVTQSPPAPAE